MLQHLGLPDKAGIGKEHIQPRISLQGIVNDGLDGVFIRRVELARVHLDARVQRVDFTRVRRQVRVVVVAEVDGPTAVVGVLVSCCAANAGGGVCSWGC